LRAIRIAAALETPYELGRAHLELGRHLPGAAPNRRQHLERAGAAFEALGCVRELAGARAALGAGEWVGLPQIR
jgi:hypothetical protein